MPVNQNILIVYATNSGNTYFVAERINEKLKKSGFSASLQAVVETKPEDFKKFDLVILGSCTWNRKTELAKVEEGQLQDQMERFVKSFPFGAARGKKFAVFGLGDRDYQYFCRAADCLNDFVSGLGGKKVGGSLRVDGFPQHQTEIIDAWVDMVAKEMRK